MKTVLLYGPGEVAKRDQLLKFKHGFKGEVISLDLKENSASDLDQAIHSLSLFESSPRLIVVENIPESLDLQSYQSNSGDGLVLMAGNLKSTSKLLDSAKKVSAKIYNFEAEKEITAFPFLDALLDKDKKAFGELEKLLDQFGGIYVLTMIYYGLRRNLLPLPASSFAAKKIAQQKSRYSLNDWRELYRLTLDTEYKIKSGDITDRQGLIFLTQRIILT